MTTKTDKQQKITEVLTQMREGKSLRQASQMAGVARQTFLDWVDKDQELAGQYAHARAAMIDKIADDIMTIADEELVATGEGRVDSAMVQKQRLRVDTRKWLLSKLSPKKYGDKLELSGDEQAPVSNPEDRACHR
jgi:transposase